MTKLTEEKVKEIEELNYHHQQEMIIAQQELANYEAKIANYEKLLRKIRDGQSRERNKSKERERAAVQKTQKIEKAVTDSIAKALKRSKQRTL